MGDSTTLSVRLDRTIKDRLADTASRLNRSSSFLVVEAIEEYLAVQEWQVDGINKALQSLDAGKGVAHNEITDWVKSWGTDNELPKPTT